MSIINFLSSTQWTPFGPAAIKTPGVAQGYAAGRIEAAAPHPTDPGIIYLAAIAGGVWKTAGWHDPNAKPTWLPLTDDQRSLAFQGYGGIAVHPASPNRVYAAVSGVGAGVLRSTNSGLGWQLLANPLLEGASLGAIVVHPASLNTLYLVVHFGGPGGGIYKSTDGGLSWTNTTSFHTGVATDLAMAPANPQRLYAGLTAGGSTNGIYFSGNGGATWQQGSGAPGGDFLGPSAIRLTASRSTVAYATVFSGEVDGKDVRRRYRTDNAGVSWAPLADTPGTPEFRPWHMLLAANPLNSNHVFANDAYILYESKDGGQNWKQVDAGIGDDWVFLTFDAGNQAVVTGDRNVYRYDHQTQKWLAREGNLQVTQFYTLTLDQQNPDLAYGVAQDHLDATRFKEEIEWQYMTAGGGETGKVAIAPSNSNLLYVSDPADPVNLVRVSLDGGQSWTTILKADQLGLSAAEYASLWADDAAKFALAYPVQKSFVLDPVWASRLLIGFTDIFKTDIASSPNPGWTRISTNLSPSSVLADRYVTAIAVGPDSGQQLKTVYAATGDGHVWRTENGGAAWKPADAELFNKNAGPVLEMRIDPANAKRCVAVTSGGVWELGANDKWISRVGDLPSNLTVLSLAVGWGHKPPILYVGTDRGVYHSIDWGAHWKKFGTTLPNTVVADLQENTTVKMLAAATFGRGAWAILTAPGKVHGIVLVEGPDPVPAVMAGVTVYLDWNGNGVLDEFEPRAVTDSQGRFSIERVPPGTSELRQVIPEGYRQVIPTEPLNLIVGQDVTDQEFRNARIRQRRRRVSPVDCDPPFGRGTGTPLTGPGEFSRD